MKGHVQQRPPEATKNARGGPWRPVRWLTAGAFLTCFAFLLGFAFFASHIGSLQSPPEVRRADAIVVVTGGQSRLDVAVDLLRTGKAKRLLISGVNPMAKREEIRAATGGDPNLFECCVDIDHAALDTIGNAEESAKWVRGHAYDSVILVTNNYHMPRTMLEMRRLLDREDLQPYPVVNSRLDKGGWLRKPEALRVLFTEYTKYLAALARAPFGLPPPTANADVVKAGRAH